MIRGFLLIFLLIGIAIVAVFGFRGQTSTGSPIEVFPDMVRQVKVRARLRSAFSPWPRLARAGPGTVPLGYEMPKPGSEHSRRGSIPGEMNAQRARFYHAPIISTRKMGRTGPGIPMQVEFT